MAIRWWLHRCTQRKISGAKDGRLGHFSVRKLFFNNVLSTHPQPHPHATPQGSDPAAVRPCHFGEATARGPLSSALGAHFRASPRAGTEPARPISARPRRRRVSSDQGTPAHLGPPPPPSRPGPAHSQPSPAPGAQRPCLAAAPPDVPDAHRFPAPPRPAPPRPRPPDTTAPYLARRPRPREAAGGGQRPRDVAWSRACPHLEQQRQRARTRGQRGAAGRGPLGGAAGPRVPPHPRGPAESGADGKRGPGRRKGSQEVTRQAPEHHAAGGAGTAPRSQVGGRRQAGCPGTPSCNPAASPALRGPRFVQAPLSGAWPNV